MTRIIKLANQIKRTGFIYNLVERTDHKAIYSQKLGDLILAYEVFKTKLIDHHKSVKGLAKLNNQEVNLEGIAEYRETFPSDEEFGKRAWTFKKLDQAQKCYQGLLHPQ